MSGSEKDFSESSNLGSPPAAGESPYSSPSQQVPHLVNVFSGISCGDDISMHADGRPYLRVVEQPQNYFRFRYKSEMVGTHGCLLGRTASASKNRTHPTVELMNYTGKALIRVRLTQSDKDDEHPHKLLEDEQEDRDVSTVVPEQGSYRVGFAGMGIIHTAKKDVAGLLFKKHMERSRNIPARDLRAHCENAAKTINLNIVRLRFSAHDIVTDKEICPPVFSEPIHNMKSAATNDLKICRISRYCGKPKGGEDVFIFVEKVNKKNILIRFYELNEHDEEVWSANASFLQSDVHHQYGIVFRTPAYKDLYITKSVKVLIELVRPSDGRTSEPKEFEYRPDVYRQTQRHNKRPRLHSAHSSLGSSSGGSILNDVPATVELLTQNDGTSNIPMYEITIPQVPVEQPMSSNDLGAALMQTMGVSYSPSAPPAAHGPLLGHPGPHGGPHGGPLTVAEPPVISLNSAELERLINHDPHLPSEEKKKLLDMDWTDYMQSFTDSLPDSKTQYSSMDFLRTSMHLVADSGNAKPIVKEEPKSPVKSPIKEQKTNIAVKSTTSIEEYTAYYKAEDGHEVKKLVKEICEIFKNKSNHKKQEVRQKLERLFEMRLSNGDTFLHMALSSNQPSLEYMVRLVAWARAPALLDLRNSLQQTVLHRALVHDQPRLVADLVAKGCDPMLADLEGNNAIHYAVICGTCLEPLLDAIKHNDVYCDLDAYNNDRQTALHLSAALHGRGRGRTEALLLAHGAAPAPRDLAARTPAHLAAAARRLHSLAAILARTPKSEIDAVDGSGNTVLQILCGQKDVDEELVDVVKILLEKGADIDKHEPGGLSARRLAAQSPALRVLLARYAPAPAPASTPAPASPCADPLADCEIKSEPEDDFDSADDMEDSPTTSGLRSLPLYIGEVSALLETGDGAWRELARRLHVDALLGWYQRTPSPAATLLTHIKESGDNISSKSLALVLEDMGETEAASVIRRYIE